MVSTDPFEDVLNLEDNFYAEGLKQGIADGERAGRAEGRAFGIETGFDKFTEAGRLYGRSLVWANRLPRAQESSSLASAAPGPASGDQPQPRQRDQEVGGRQRQQQQQQRRRRHLPGLNGGARLEKSVLMLHGLVELETLATENSTEAVDDFDDRVKRAQGRAKVVERQTGEDAVPAAPPRGNAAPAVGLLESNRGGDRARQDSSSSSSSAVVVPPHEGSSF